MRVNRKQALRVFVFCLGIVGIVLLWKAATLLNWNPRYAVGEELDSHNGVAVYYNGGVGHTAGRNLAPDGYNIGIRWQCVEFVKRYYYEHLGHRMPDSYGHAKHFFDPAIPDGAMNSKRDLLQFSNPSPSRPLPDDLVVFAPTLLNRYGHVAIVSEVTENDIEIVQQNPGPFGSSRERIELVRHQDGIWEIGGSKRIHGWLRKESGTGHGSLVENPELHELVARAGEHETGSGENHADAIGR